MHEYEKNSKLEVEKSSIEPLFFTLSLKFLDFKSKKIKRKTQLGIFQSKTEFCLQSETAGDYPQFFVLKYV